VLFSVVTEVKLVDRVVANPYPYTNCDYSFATVSLISPENKTYDTNSILLNITAGAYPGLFFVGYCLDGGPFVQVAPEKWDAHTFSESVWLNGLSKGSHYIIVEASTPETPNNIVTDSSQVYFTITKDLVPEPTTTPLPTINTGPSSYYFDDFIFGGIAGAVAIAVLVLLLYFIKRK
jgi:hypothetical protein